MTRGARATCRSLNCRGQVVQGQVLRPGYRERPAARRGVGDGAFHKRGDIVVELDDQRLERMTHNARNLAHAGHLRDDVSVEQAAELVWTYTAPELYEVLVRKRGWPLERFRAFIADALIAALLSPGRSGS